MGPLGRHREITWGEGDWRFANRPYGGWRALGGRFFEGIGMTCWEKVMGSRPGGQNGKVGIFGVAGGWCGESKTGAHEGRPYGGWRALGGGRFFEGIGMAGRG